MVGGLEASPFFSRAPWLREQRHGSPHHGGCRQDRPSPSSTDAIHATALVTMLIPSCQSGQAPSDGVDRCIRARTAGRIGQGHPPVLARRPVVPVRARRLADRAPQRPAAPRPQHLRPARRPRPPEFDTTVCKILISLGGLQKMLLQPIRGAPWRASVLDSAGVAQVTEVRQLGPAFGLARFLQSIESSTCSNSDKTPVVARAFA